MLARSPLHPRGSARHPLAAPAHQGAQPDRSRRAARRRHRRPAPVRAGARGALVRGADHGEPHHAEARGRETEGRAAETEARAGEEEADHAAAHRCAGGGALADRRAARRRPTRRSRSRKPRRRRLRHRPPRPPPPRRRRSSRRTSTPTTCDNPRARRIRRVARRIGEQGRVDAARARDAPTGCRSRSSCARRAARRASTTPRSKRCGSWRSCPARRGDTPVAAWVLVPISFRLEELSTDGTAAGAGLRRTFSPRPTALGKAMLVILLVMSVATWYLIVTKASRRGSSSGGARGASSTLFWNSPSLAGGRSAPRGAPPRRAVLAPRLARDRRPRGITSATARTG